MKKIASLFLCLFAVLALQTTALAAGTYTDVPEGSWAEAPIEKAAEYGLMQGVGDGAFGYGQPMRRAEFVTVLVRMFGWDFVTGEDAASDIAHSWANSYINAAAAHGVFDPGGEFRPDDLITRSEMATMLVRALGLKPFAEANAEIELPFTDVGESRGYVSVAYDVGMTTGIDAVTFAPNDTALREQAATMLVRVYEKCNGPTAWKHAFYAISSYSQIGLAKNFDAVSVGWSQMSYTKETGAQLQMDRSDGDFYLPASYDQVVRELDAAGVSVNLNVFMAGTPLADMLADEAARSQAVTRIVNEMERRYPALGYNPYDGVTIDFEGLRAQSSGDFVAFLTELSEKLAPLDKSLYVAVMPPVGGEVYYDGYDFAAIGALADKVILMAHDYSPLDLTGFVPSSYHKNMALTPISKVYDSVRIAAKAMEDPSKLVLQLSMDATAWWVDADGMLQKPQPTRPVASTIYRRLLQSESVMGWSDTFRNPYLTYMTEDGQHIFLWYEDARSVGQKLGVAKLLGVANVSVWRLGLIPDYDGVGLYYNVMETLQ